MDTLPAYASLLLIFLISGCATTAGSQEGVFRTELGKTSSRDAEKIIRSTLQTRYGYSLDREIVTKEQIRFTTNWKVHTLNEDEKRKGISSCRTRVEVQARPARRAGGGVREYRVEMIADYQIRTDEGDWKLSTIPESRNDYLKELSALMENQFGGTRTF